MKKKQKAIIDDGMNSELVQNALFDGILEIPHINPPIQFCLPLGMTPFTQRHHLLSQNELIVFFEHDIKFAEILKFPELYIDDFQKAQAISTLDCSVYRDMPFAAQLMNIYRKQAIGYFYQSKGIEVYPCVRWGDDRTYSTKYYPEAAAFLGIEPHSPVVISTYGCIHGKDNTYHFKAGLEAMIDTLHPSIIMVYGSMPESIFSSYLQFANFVKYPDWITRVKGGKQWELE